MKLKPFNYNFSFVFASRVHNASSAHTMKKTKSNSHDHYHHHPHYANDFIRRQDSNTITWNALSWVSLESQNARFIQRNYSWGLRMFKNCLQQHYQTVNQQQPQNHQRRLHRNRQHRLLNMWNARQFLI